jgi:hypothetical protein
MRYWSPPYEAKPKVVFWTSPTSVEDAFMQIFRQVQAIQSGYGEQHFMKALIFHTKEDFQGALKRLQHSRALDAAEIQDKIRVLKHYRRWVLSEHCRLQSLLAFYQGTSIVEMLPCGLCDRCLSNGGKRSQDESTVQRLLKRWFY